MNYFNLISSSLMQILLFTIIPFFWWILKTDKEVSFFTWIGLKLPKTTNKKKYLIIFIGILGLMPVLLLITNVFLPDSAELATAQFFGQGMNAFMAAIIYGFLQTGLSEEIFFRGFLTKRFINKYNFFTGNNMQAIIFGMVHGILFFALYSWFWITFIVLMSAIIGWLMGYINERLSSGSIISSWLIHGTVNTLMALIAALGIVS